MFGFIGHMDIVECVDFELNIALRFTQKFELVDIVSWEMCLIYCYSYVTYVWLERAIHQEKNRI